MPEVDADIESTLVFASAAGMGDGDLRVLSVLTTWLGVHHAHVHSEPLSRRTLEVAECLVQVLGGTPGAHRYLVRSGTQRVVVVDPLLRLGRELLTSTRCERLASRAVRANATIPRELHRHYRVAGA